MQRPRHFQQLLSLHERLDQEAARLRAQAEKLPHGSEREMFVRRARHAEAATQVDEWLSSSGLQAPR